MHFSTIGSIALAGLLSLATAQDFFPPTDVLNVLVTAIPSADLVSLQQPSGKASLLKAYQSGSLPAWYGSLPPNAKSWFQSAFAAATSSNAQSTATATATTNIVSATVNPEPLTTPPTPGQNLTAILATLASVSKFYASIQKDPAISVYYSGVKNVTAFIPDNDSYDTLKNGPYASLLNDQDAVHQSFFSLLVPGVYESAQFDPAGIFLHTSQTNSSYTNVTGGAVAEILRQGDQKILRLGPQGDIVIKSVDIYWDGGILHIISGNFLSTPLTIEETGKTLDIDSVNVAAETGLLDTIQYTPDVTYFTLSNFAFESFKDQASKLSTSDSTKLINYATVTGAALYSSAFISGGQNVTTKGGDQLNIGKDASGNLTVNGIPVVKSDVLTANGVMHIVGAPLFPPGWVPSPARSAKYRRAF